MRHTFDTITPTSKRRDLRSHMTVQEVRLWIRLKQRGILGYKFRRQHPIGPYITDFYCPKLRLAIELDGGHHFETQHYTYDRERQKFIEAGGVMVVRYPNSDVDDDIDVVLENLMKRIRRRTRILPPRLRQRRIHPSYK